MQRFEVTIPGGEKVEFDTADEAIGFLRAHRASGMLTEREWNDIEIALNSLE